MLNQCGILLISQSSLANKIQRYITKAQNLFKVKVENRNTESFIEDVNSFDLQLFDVATCKCNEFSINREILKDGAITDHWWCRYASN